MNLMYPKMLEKLEEWIRTGEVIKFYQSKEWRRLRRLALTRDNNECQHCKKKGLCIRHPLEVHHINEVKIKPDKALELENLITLCIPCHNKVHEKGYNLNGKNIDNKKYPEYW